MSVLSLLYVDIVYVSFAWPSTSRHCGHVCPESCVCRYCLCTVLCPVQVDTVDMSVLSSVYVDIVYVSVPCPTQADTVDMSALSPVYVNVVYTCVLCPA